MAQIAKRKTSESWRDAVATRAREAGQLNACLALFDGMVAAGRAEADAAFRTLATHGLLWDLPAPVKAQQTIAEPPDPAAPPAI
jgi:hypothetical protein